MKKTLYRSKDYRMTADEERDGSYHAIHVRTGILVRSFEFEPWLAFKAIQESLGNPFIEVPPPDPWEGRAALVVASLMRYELSSTNAITVIAAALKEADANGRRELLAELRGKSRTIYGVADKQTHRLDLWYPEPQSNDEDVKGFFLPASALEDK